MALKYGEVWIITGVVVGGESENARIIGDGVCIPVGLYKIIVYMEEGMVDAMAFLVGNSRRGYGGERGFGNRINLHEYRISIDYIEAMTGFDFLCALTNDVEESIESHR